MSLLAFVLMSSQFLSSGHVAAIPTVRVGDPPYQDAGLDLEARWTRALAVVSNQSARRRIEPIVDLRKRLDACRAETLIRIRSVAADDDGSARDESKALIRPAVERIRRLLNSAAIVDVPRSFREALEELECHPKRQIENGLASAGLASVPEWLLSIDPKDRWLTIRTFAWDRTERARWDENQRIAEKDFDRFHVCCPGPDDRSPSIADMELVRLVNEHRNMFGLPSLRWSVTLQESARSSSAPITSGGSDSVSSPTVRIIAGPALVSVYTGRVCALWGDRSAAPEAVLRSWCDCTPSYAALLANEWHEMACCERDGKWILLFGSADRTAR